MASRGPARTDGRLARLERERERERERGRERNPCCQHAFMVIVMVMKESRLFLLILSRENRNIGWKIRIQFEVEGSG